MGHAPRAYPDIVKPDDPSTWELTWSMGVTPWEKGDKQPQPSLHEAIVLSGLELPRSGRALVPGCGAGYDVQYIAEALGLECIGLDIADTAIKRANELLDIAKAQHPGLNAIIRNGDFFVLDPPKSELFDLIYDHTFFCAIPPALRNDWGKQMGKLIKSGGFLITIVYPMLPYEPTGPPYYIRPEHYDELLTANFVKVLDKIPKVSSPSHEGKERLVVWKRL